MSDLRKRAEELARKHYTYDWLLLQAMAEALDAAANRLYDDYVWCDVSEAEKLRSFVCQMADDLRK